MKHIMIWKKIILILFNLTIFILYFFQIYIYNMFNYDYAPAIIFTLAIVISIIDLIFIFIKILKYKIFIHLLLLIIPIIGFILCYFTTASTKVVFDLELFKAKRKMENILSNNIYYNNVLINNDLYFFTVVKNEYGLISLVYNNTKYFEKINNIEIHNKGGIIIKEDIYINDYKIMGAKKIEENWYICALEKL